MTRAIIVLCMFGALVISAWPLIQALQNVAR
jgi:hypothetical protein